MSEQISQFVDRLKSNTKLIGYDEICVKNGVILPLLGYLGWNPFDTDEVTPEYVVEGDRVDYALRINNTNEFFVEVKRPSEDLEKHQTQLLDYSFHEGVELAALTNGITWWFYLGTHKGPWQERKFYAVDILEQDTPDIVDKLVALLGKHNVQSGEALKNAEAIYKDKRKKLQIEQALPEAWNRTVSEPEGFLVDLIVESTERLCGFKPDGATVVDFLNSHRQQFLVTALDSVRTKTRGNGFSGRPYPPSTEPKGTQQGRKLGRKGFSHLPDYLVPVVRMMRNGMVHTEAFRKQAQTLGVDSTTVSSLCTRSLGLSTREFADLVANGRIVSVLEQRYPREADLIERELGQASSRTRT